MHCSNCGKELETDARFCNNCGNPITLNTSTNTSVVSAGNHEKTDVGSKSFEEIAEKAKQQQNTVIQPRPSADEKYCSTCGSVIKKIAEICPKCGVKQVGITSQTNQKNNIVFFVLTIFFAVVGMAVFMIGYFSLESQYIESKALVKQIHDFNEWYKEIIRIGYQFYYKYVIIAAIASSLLGISILFSVFSLYRKPNKLYLWLSISSCILLALWNIFVLLRTFIFL